MDRLKAYWTSLLDDFPFWDFFHLKLVLQEGSRMHGRASVPVQAMGTPCFEQQEGCCSECCVQLWPCCWNALKEDDRILMEDVESMLCGNSFHCFETHSCQLMMFLKILALDCSTSGQRLVAWPCH